MKSKKKKKKQRIKAISLEGKEIDFSFVGKFRTQTATSPSWNWEGEKLFKRIPCGNCGQLFTDNDLINKNYHLWTDERFSWVDKKLNCYWDRHLINYQVIDKDNECRKFKDGKQLVLKLAFVITDITHKHCG